MARRLFSVRLAGMGAAPCQFQPLARAKTAVLQYNTSGRPTVQVGGPTSGRPYKWPTRPTCSLGAAMAGSGWVALLPGGSPRSRPRCGNASRRWGCALRLLSGTVRVR